VTPDRGLILVLGPPLAGKSTLAGQLAAERPGTRTFSVRAHFEPLRRIAPSGLPPVGTMLPDRTVVAAAGPVLDHAATGLSLLDGIPATAGQLDLVLAALPRDMPVHGWWLGVDEVTAAVRASRRIVCPGCDGGVHQAERGTDGRCARCGGELGRRPDDDAVGFAARWRSFARRAPALRERLVHHGVLVRHR
jgi:adenylate kinase